MRKFQEYSEETLKFDFLPRNLGFLGFWVNSKRVTLREIWENPRIWFPCQKWPAFTPSSIFSNKNLKLRKRENLKILISLPEIQFRNAIQHLFKQSLKSRENSKSTLRKHQNLREFQENSERNLWEPLNLISLP